MRFLYSIGLYLYTFGIRLAALVGHQKARQMVQGWQQWSSAVRNLEAGRPTAWFHAASLGEFEQARPVLETFRQRHPDYQVVVTFFSPSGYEVRKNYPHAEALCYLPMDTPRNVRHFLQLVNPTMVFFVKYEFWYNYLGALRTRGIPTYLFSSIFRPEQYFFRWYGGWFRRQLRTCFRHIFVQNAESLAVLRGHGVEQCSLAGDTRFDRVHQIAQAAEGNAVVEAFLANHEGDVLVAGSTWPPDEQLLADAMLNGATLATAKIILAPHVISEEHLKQIEGLFPDSIRYSAVSQLLSAQDSAPQSSCSPATYRILIIDNIGLLSKIYRYATVAYIGGGFGVGIHNILEAVTFGKPVLFGPNYHKFQEACDIVERGGGWSVASSADFVARTAPLWQNDADGRTPTSALAQASQVCLTYMNDNLGSTEKILSLLDL